MIRERVEFGERSYEIVIGAGLLGRTGEILNGFGVRASSRHLLVTDENVKQAGHLDPVLASLEEASYRVEVFVIAPGEVSKSWDKAGEALQFAFHAGLDRRSVVLALGGGVVGDFAGFVAATYMRGIPFVQMPTTLLAHDSAVGGKVAVNLPLAKNVIGAFHQPLGVIYDTDALGTLPSREIRSGLAEAIKHGVIRDPQLFDWIEGNLEAILQNEEAVMAELLARSCRIKAVVVAADETEQGVRAILNFGHTLGHAVESLSRGRFSHGEGVAVGMVFAAELSRQLGVCDAATVERIERATAAAGLPVRIPADLHTDEMIASMRQDKKATGGTLTFVLVRELGDVTIDHDVPEAVVRSVIEMRRERRA
jgi:3-dehydroquinate synthase